MQPIGQEPQSSFVGTTEKSTELQVDTQEKRSSTITKKTLRSDGEDEINDSNVHEILRKLFDEVESKKKMLSREEEAFKRGQDRLNSLQREHADLSRVLEESQRRRKERLRIQGMLREDSNDCKHERIIASDGGSDSDENSHYGCSSSSSSSYRRRPCCDGAKKERKRLRRFQRDVSLRFQLLQSECQRSELQVEKLMADLRREYADSCLFGSSITF